MPNEEEAMRWRKSHDLLECTRAPLSAHCTGAYLFQGRRENPFSRGGLQGRELDATKCGFHGVHPGNIHKDLMASFCKGIDLPDPFHLEVPCKNPKTLKKDSEVAAIYLPHLMFAKLATYSKFETIFPLELLEQFWDQAEKT